MVYEDDEVIALTLISTNSNIAIIGSSTQIEIEDNDSKDISCGLCNNHVRSVYLSKDVTVEWAEKSYSDSEGNNITVCALHQEQAERSFTLNISAPSSMGMKEFQLRIYLLSGLFSNCQISVCKEILS